MVPNGSIVTYVGTWPHATLNTPDHTTGNVLAALAKDGLASVRPPQVDSQFLGAITRQPFKVTLFLQVENGGGFSDEGDIVDLVRHEVYQELGSFPLSDDTPYIQYPGDTSANPTVQASVSSSYCIAGKNSDTSGGFSVGCWFKNLTTTGLSTVGLLSLIAIAGIGLAVWASGKVK
jgi:hypothetical protein